MRAGVCVLHLRPDYFCPAAQVARMKFESVTNKETVAALPPQKVSAVDHNRFCGFTAHSINDSMKESC